LASFQYDALDNLRVSQQGSRHHRVDYDPLRNLPMGVRNASGVLQYGLVHNAMGALTSNRQMGYVFDEAKRLRSVTGVAAYSYDGHGRRVRETPLGGVTQHQVYTRDGEKRLFRNGSGMNRFVFLGGELVAIDPYDNGVLGNRVYVHTNYLGSTEVRSLASTGQVQRRHYYTAYGEAWNSVVDGMGYTGHEMDANTGLTYMQQRYQDPVLGRFISPDPVETLANPINHFGRS
jgi:RHS repeat-associated protein